MFESRTNVYGDIIARGMFVNNELNGCGCKWSVHGWIKSPHFIKNRVFGLACIFDVNDDIIFYGYMYNDKIVTEKLEYHPFLSNEYDLVCKPPDYVHSVVRFLYC